MEARMKQPALVIPEAMTAMHTLSNVIDDAAKGSALPLLELVYLRASQINGCSVCVHMHARDARKAGESNDRIDGVAAWRDMPYFTDSERAALDLTESLTRLSDRPRAVSDAVYDEAARHFDESEMATLILAISQINVWNRLNAATMQIAGEW